MSDIRRPTVEVRLASARHPILRCEGEFDASNASEFEAHLWQLVKRAPDSLLLDLTEVGFLDVRILSAIVAARRELESQGTKLKIAAGGQPLRVFEQTGVAVNAAVFPCRPLEERQHDALPGPRAAPAAPKATHA